MPWTSGALQDGLLDLLGVAHTAAYAAAWAVRKSGSRKSTFPCPISDPAANMQ